MFDKYGFTTPKKRRKIGGDIAEKKKKATVHHIRLRLVRTLTISCGALRANKSAIGRLGRGRTPRKSKKKKGGERDILSILIRASGLVDVHSVLVLPPRTRRGTLARVLLLPQTLCDLLEHHVERFLVLRVLPRLDGVVFRERYELRV
jgi:hypothetical protein